ncbi:MAG: cadmium-translocating P-type ATPase [Prevotella sp.]|jgi:Cd2+/Zn2+-exporting ATPase|nr:cadmium-translocating P-type ATPase [Prevotella sp.]
MKRKLIRIIVTALLLVAAWGVSELWQLAVWQQLIVFLVPYVLISYDVLGEAWEGIMERDPFNEDFLMSVATIGALLIGFIPGAETQFPEAVFVMLFFQVGEVFEDYAEDKSRDSISELMNIRPDKANLETNGNIEVVDPSMVRVGDIIMVKPGEIVPLDGVVVDGVSSLNTVALTGESVPREIAVGGEVLSGCVNISGVLKVKVKKLFGESTASKIINLVEQAGERKSKSENFIRRFAHVYTPIVVFAAIALAVIPSLITGDVALWVYRALTFLVVSCPCALVISVPLTFFGGIGGASRNGILIKGANYMDTLAKIGTVVFDKTGTLTKGVFAVDAVHPEEYDEKKLLSIAAAVEQYSTHPIAVALREASAVEAANSKIENVEEIAGHGVKAVVDGKQVSVGNEKLMNSLGITLNACEECKHHAGTVVHVAIDDMYAGHIVISDQIKSDSKEAISALKKLGVEKTVMLTGDQQRVAEHVAKQLQLDEYYAQLLPADKVSKVEQMLSAKPSGTHLAFVGDGINDAPVLARADVGIAMGALGSDAAIEAADVVLMDDKPSKIAQAIRIARKTILIAKENVWFAIIVKVAILLFTAAGLLGSLAMAIAVFGDVGVMVLCVLNATRALSFAK